MPIRKENKGLYPANWKSEIVPMVRARSGNRCEMCGVEHGAWVARTPSRDKFVRVKVISATTPMVPFGNAPVWDAATGKHTGEVAAQIELHNPVRIILTVAHLNHDPTDNRPENLRHWCQLHHNQYDAKTRAAGRKSRKP